MGNSINAFQHFLLTQPTCKVVCVTEHWKSEDELVHKLNNFNLISYVCRDRGKHGGSAIYIHEEVKCKRRKKLEEFSIIGQFECASAELSLGSESFIVLSVYRPCSAASDIEVFLSQLEKVLAVIIEENKFIIVAGDFNIDILENTSKRSDFLTLLCLYQLFPTINVPTRVTSCTSTCLDNIFVNFNADSEVLSTTVSDHFGQKISFTVMSKENNNNRLVYRRFYNEEDKINFCDGLKQEDWQAVFSIEESNIDLQWESFMKSFFLIFEEHFPLKLVKLGKKNLKNYYDTKEVRESKRKLDILLTLKSHDSSCKALYNIEKQNYDKLLTAARTDFYNVKIQSSDNKNKTMWSICNDIRGTESKNKNKFFSEGPDSIAEKYNKFLVDKIPIMLSDLGDEVFSCNLPNNPRSIDLHPTNPNEIVEIINKIKNKYCSGDDGIPVNIMKYCADEIKGVISHIVNNSLKFGIFPKNLKLALIKPIYKKGDDTCFESYRPISILSSFSKIFEHVMCERLLTFMKECNLFNDSQHGYLEGRSVQTALYQFTERVIGLLEEDKLGLGLFVDLASAYDCLFRPFLLIKLEKLGIRGSAKDWIASYLSERSQRVSIVKNGKDVKSDIIESNYGVPQGSVIGPILFIIFIIDICDVIEDILKLLTSFVDDTNLMIGGNDFDDIKAKTLSIYNELKSWFTKNKLLMNENKTSAVLFSTSRSQKMRENVLDLKGCNVKIEESIKFLGVYLDGFLKWSYHIDYLSGKLCRVGFGIRTLSRYLSLNNLKTVYFANFECLLRYGIIFWGSSSEVNKLFVLQKRVMRYIFKMTSIQSCRGLFKRNKMLTIFGIYVLECLLFFFKNKDIFSVHTIKSN